MKDIHRRIEQLKNSVGRGSFCPATLRALFLFDEFLIAFAGENAVFKHEYMHFLQATTTSFGIKRFILENKLVWKVQLCINELLKHRCLIRFPLEKYLQTTDQRIVREIISRYKAERDDVLIELALLNGDCTLDSDGTVRCSGREIKSSTPVLSRVGHPPFMSYQSDEGHKEMYSIGSTAIMECGADLYEGAILGFLSGALREEGDADDPRPAFKEWQMTPAEPIYAIVYDFANEIVGKPVPPGTLLALLDLALCPPLDFPFDQSLTGHDVEVHPGKRLLEELQCVRGIGFMERNIPYVSSKVHFQSCIGYNFHEIYRPYVERICKILNWPLPWDVMNNTLRDFLMKSFYKNLPGPAQILLNGLALRKNMPSYCANPLEDTKPFLDQGAIPLIIEDHEFTNPDSFDSTIPAVFVDRLYWLHSPPMFFSTSGKTEFANSKVHYKFLRLYEENGQRREFGTDADNRLMKESLEDWFMISNLAETLWRGTGTEFEDAFVKCLKLFAEMEPQCDGFLRFGNANKCEGTCKMILQKAFWLEPEEIQWI